jgi:hypothetical protein
MNTKTYNEIERITQSKLYATFHEGGWQGTEYMLFVRPDKTMTILHYHYGTCGHCDWEIGLQDHSDPNASYYENMKPLIDDFVSEANFVSANDLLAQFHMIFGVSSYDTSTSEKMRVAIKNAMEGIDAQPI